MHWAKVCVVFILFPIKAFILFFIFHRFSETESLAVLSMLVSQYKFTIKEEPQFAGETFEEKKSRILSTHRFMTLAYVL